jgi:hypothetical protein
MVEQASLSIRPNNQSIRFWQKPPRCTALGSGCCLARQAIINCEWYGKNGNSIGPMNSDGSGTHRMSRWEAPNILKLSPFFLHQSSYVLPMKVCHVVLTWEGLQFLWRDGEFVSCSMWGATKICYTIQWSRAYTHSICTINLLWAVSALITTRWWHTSGGSWYAATVAAGGGIAGVLAFSLNSHL